MQEKEAFRRAGNARFPRQGDTGGRSIWEDGQLPAAGQTARAPRCKCKTVKALSPTLGIAGESPQYSEDLQRKARPEGERPNNHPQKLL